LTGGRKAALMGVAPLSNDSGKHREQAGKPPKVVIVACMRKLLTIINAMLKHNTPWQAQGARPEKACCSA
jgi:transposase